MELEERRAKGHFQVPAIAVQIDALGASDGGHVVAPIVGGCLAVSVHELEAIWKKKQR